MPVTTSNDTRHTPAETRGGSTYYYMQDGLGSVRNLVDSSETTQNIYDTYAFGDNIAYAQTENIASPYRYTGREFELGSYDSTHYYRNRYYIPYLGIFASRDAAWADVTRGWGYVGNLPTMFTDAYGLSAPTIVQDFWDFIRGMLTSLPETPDERAYSKTYPWLPLSNLDDCQMSCYWKCIARKTIPFGPDVDAIADAMEGVGPWGETTDLGKGFVADVMIDKGIDKIAITSAVMVTDARGLVRPMCSSTCRAIIGSPNTYKKGLAGFVAKEGARGLAKSAAAVGMHLWATATCAAEALDGKIIDGMCVCAPDKCPRE